MAIQNGFDRENYPELKQYWKKFDSTVIPFIQIKTEINDTMNFWQSKFGGSPYWPKNIEYPIDSAGKPLYLIAQLNFEEIPQLEGFPQNGILEWFVSPESFLYGLDDYKFDAMITQKNWRVVYFAEIEKNIDNLISDFSFLPNPKDYETWPPVLKPCSLKFKKEYAPVAVSDYQFTELFGDPFDFFEQLGEVGSEVMDAYSIDYSGRGHKIGGYADFAQVDPREPSWGYNTLLLQLDSEPSKDIDFGSAGVGHLFIKDEDLKKLEFSKIMYHWDCG